MRVLLVEDNPVDVQVLIDQLDELEGAGVELTHVESLAALEQHAATPPDVVLLDLSLPDGEGAESVRRARSLLSDPPIVVMTADDDASRSLEMLREGAEDYLVKGHYSGDTLLRALRYARERHELKGRLAHADRLAVVGQLAAGVAHEVSNPAALVLANTSIMDDLLASLERPQSRATGEGISPDFALAEIRRMLDENRAGLERIRSVVRDLQGYSRLERTEVERVDVNGLVARTCSLLRSTVRHRARIDQRLAPVPELAADRGKLEQLLTNLIVNATHALDLATGRRQPHIIVSTREEQGNIVLSVEDNGCGMSEEVQQRIFEPFFTTKDADRGTGLGMAIASDIVRHHAGHIECTSEEGRGTRFDVWLPLDNGLRLPPCPEDDDRVSGLRGRVLLIDDEPDVAAVYGDLLGEHHEVVVANGGREARDLLEGDDAFDAIVCDLMMPEINGVDLYELMERRDAELARRFIFCSGGLVTQQARDFAQRVPNQLLYKPTSIEDLLGALDRVLADGAATDAERDTA